ncbi:MAG: hypothetical protein GXX78_13565 [Bacteroidales bacterium]|nr:hypothetical protein [Bacteroidales bacterium]
MSKKNQKIYQNQKNLKPSLSKKKNNGLENLASKPLFFPLFFLCVTFLAYFNSFTVPFLFDDYNQILNRANIHSFTVFNDLSFWLNVNQRPFSLFTLAVNYHFGGENVFGYHLLNVFIHFLSGLFLFYWLRMLPEVNSSTRRSWLPLLATLFFLLHPAQIQSVTYIIQRMTSLAGMFLILSVLLYTYGRLEHVRQADFRKGFFYYCAAILAGVLGLLSKQNAVVFPVVFLLVEFFFIRNKGGKIYRTYLISMLAVGIVALAAALVLVGLPTENASISRVDYLATQMQVIPRYFQLMLLPIGLSIDQGVKIVDGFFNVWSLLGALFNLAMLGFSIYMVKKEPLISFGILWIYITLFIESSIFPITDPMFDQRMYLPLAGFSLVLLALADRYFFSRNQPLLKPVVVVVLCLLCGATIARNNLFNEPVRVWKDVTQKHPKHLRGWMALGKTYFEQGDYSIPEAINCFETAREIAPSHEENLLDLGAAYLATQQNEKAISCFSILANSDNPEFKSQALRVMAAYNAGRKNIEESAKYFNDLLVMNPADHKTREALFMLYFNESNFLQAANVAKKWLAAYPRNAQAHHFMGKAQFSLNNKNEAEKYLNSALNIDSNHAESMMLLSNIYVNRFEYDKAISILEQAYTISKNNSIPKNIDLIKQLKQKVPAPTN